MSRNPEQVKFYHSRQWAVTRIAYMAEHDFICERCGKPATVVHHRRYITPSNVRDPSVTLDPDNLECLCSECHNREHHGTGATAPGLRFDSDGGLVAV